MRSISASLGVWPPRIDVPTATPATARKIIVRRNGAPMKKTSHAPDLLRSCSRLAPAASPIHSEMTVYARLSTIESGSDLTTSMRTTTTIAMIRVTRIDSHHFARLILPLKLKRICPRFMLSPSLPNKDPESRTRLRCGKEKIAQSVKAQQTQRGNTAVHRSPLTAQVARCAAFDWQFDCPPPRTS